MRMKKAVKLLLISALGLIFTFTPFSASASEVQPLGSVPYLTSISFNNAEIEGGFNQSKTTFNLVLADNAVSPSLKDYAVSGSADLFVTYNYDETNRQTGITVTLSFENGTVFYTFHYKNAEKPAVNSNADLLGVVCELGELQPAFDKNTTAYKLYLPSDLTHFEMAAVTEDINAYCAPINMELRENQETDFSFVVTASDGTTKTYKFKIKRVNKTMAQVKAEMAQDGFESFVYGELFYQKPIFNIVFFSAVGGIAVIAVLIVITKRITVNPYDSDEKEFYSPIE